MWPTYRDRYGIIASTSTPSSAQRLTRSVMNPNRRSCTTGLSEHSGANAVAFQNRPNTRSTEVLASGLPGSFDGKNQSGRKPSNPRSQAKYSEQRAVRSSATWTTLSLRPFDWAMADAPISRSTRSLGIPQASELRSPQQ